VNLRAHRLAELVQQYESALRVDVEIAADRTAGMERDAERFRTAETAALSAIPRIFAGGWEEESPGLYRPRFIRRPRLRGRSAMRQK
jgi:hypothetical protein